MDNDEEDPVLVDFDRLKSQTIELWQEARQGSAEAKRALKEMEGQLFLAYKRIHGKDFDHKSFAEERQGDGCLFCSERSGHHRNCPVKHMNHGEWHRGYRAGKDKSPNIFKEGSTEWLGWAVGIRQTLDLERLD